MDSESEASFLEQQHPDLFRLPARIQRIPTRAKELRAVKRRVRKVEVMLALEGGQRRQRISASTTNPFFCLVISNDRARGIILEKSQIICLTLCITLISIRERFLTVADGKPNEITGSDEPLLIRSGRWTGQAELSSLS